MKLPGGGISNVSSRSKLSIAQLLAALPEPEPVKPPGFDPRSIYLKLSLPVSAVVLRMERDVKKLAETVERQAAGHTLMILNRLGTGKWSNLYHTGTKNMERRYARRPKLLKAGYAQEDPITGLPRTYALAASTREGNLIRKRREKFLAQKEVEEERKRLRTVPASLFQPTHELYPSIDEPIMKTLEELDYYPIDNWLTYAELESISPRKYELRRMTEPLEEAAAKAVARGFVLACINTVTSYLVHLQVTQERIAADKARSTANFEAVKKKLEERAMASTAARKPTGPVHVKTAEEELAELRSLALTGSTASVAASVGGGAAGSIISAGSSKVLSSAGMAALSLPSGGGGKGGAAAQLGIRESISAGGPKLEVLEITDLKRK